MARQTNQERAKELKDFGKNLAVKRMAAGVDRQGFAAKCGLSYKHYFNIENGTTRPSMLAYISICRVLGVQVPLVG